MNKSSHTKSQRAKQQALIAALGLTPEVLQDGVNAFLENLKRLLLESLLQSEVNEIVGRPFKRKHGRQVVRWGSEVGTAIADGGKIEITRPRIRLLKRLSEKGGEVQLETYKTINRIDLIDGPLTAAVLNGVSARAYSKLICREVKRKGVKKSNVSRQTVASSKQTVDEFLKKRLDWIEPTVILIDGVNLGGRQALACIAIENSGKKHVLGVRLGSTENQILCRDLIRDLIERGLSAENNYLFIIDGSKALAAAVRAAFGPNTQIQRCQEHKIRDVQAYLPVKKRLGIRQKLQAAYAQPTEKAALHELNKIRIELSTVSEKAANALAEGMYETVTVHRLGIKGLLRKSLRTTNIVESLFSSVRRYMGRVGRFQNDAQRDLWFVRSLLEAERHLRTVEGNRQLASLRKKLNNLAERKRSKSKI